MFLGFWAHKYYFNPYNLLEPLNLKSKETDDDDENKKEHLKEKNDWKISNANDSGSRNVTNTYKI